MPATPTCPRCDAGLRAPGLWSSDWRCERHGAVVPLGPAVRADPVSAAIRDARVPAWLPWPMPAGWLLTGVRVAGDDRDGAAAVGVACSGPGVLGGADLVLVAEEPGVGLGARYGGHRGVDAGELIASRPPDSRVTAAGHETVLWAVPAGADRAAFVGEAAGAWLWAVVWPVDEWLVVQPTLRLVDLREPGPAQEAPAGALSPRLR